MIAHIRKQYKQGFWWIPSETDRRGFKLPDETFLSMKAELEPYKDEKCIQVALMHVEGILSSRESSGGTNHHQVGQS